MLNKRQHVYGFRNFNHNLNYVTMIQNYNQNIKYWWLYDGQSTQLLGDVCGLWEYIVELIHNATFRYVVMTCCTLQNILRHHDNAKFAHMNGHWKAYNHENWRKIVKLDEKSNHLFSYVNHYPNILKL